MARVLVVDDVRFILQMMAGIFEEHGHQVLTAENGEKALELAGAESLDLVLLDIAMPGIDGLEVARRLRADPRTVKVPILMVTAQSEKKHAISALEAGANDCLAKPFETHVLLAKAAELLGGYRMNFSVEAVGGFPLVTSLTAELGAGHSEEFLQALDAARTVAGTFLLDLSRVAKVDPACVSVVLSSVREMKEEARAIEVVRPGAGVGTRSLISELEPYARMHDTRENALTALGLEPVEVVTERLSAVLPPLPVPDPSPDPPAAATDLPAAATDPPAAATASPRKGPVCIVESIGKVAMVRVRTESFAQAFPEVRAEVLPLAGQNVVLSMKGIAAIDADDAGEIGSLASELSELGRQLRLSNPEPAVIQTLEAAGLADLLGNKKPTRASS